MRLIDADKLQKDISVSDSMIDDYGIKTGYAICMHLIDKQPTIEPERKVGEWIDQKGGGCCCSECGRYALDEVDGNFIHVAAKSNYCPNCGAKMDGSE